MKENITIHYADDDAEDLEIFKKAAEKSGCSDYPGSGIGLALCKKIMTTHKGHILAEGKPAHGAIFLLCFPLRDE